MTAAFTGIALLIASCFIATTTRAQAPHPPARARGDSATSRDSSTDSLSASLALRAMIADVATAGRTAPDALRGYRVGVESEIAIVLRTAAAREGAASATGGAEVARERVLQVEQVESTLGWQRGGSIEQHVVGYRSRAVTASISALSYFRRPWVVPVLYGNRLQVLLGHDSVRATTDTASTGRVAAERARDALLAVHPFADDRDRYYRLAGGDTVAVLRIGERSVPVVRLPVEPLASTRTRTLLFRGEIDIDAGRSQIVRMRGQFVVRGAQRSLIGRVLTVGWQTVAFAELVNGEYDGRFWLPTEQRIEAQARSPLAGEFSPIVRVVSHFSHYTLDVGPAGILAGDSAGVSVTVARLTFAPRDSLNAFHGWLTEIGAATGGARANDFDDVAPDSWRPQGAPRLDWRAERLNDVLRYNRVEGTFTGAAATLRLRDAVPGLTLGSNAGWAWTEQTMRGALWGRWVRGPWTYGARTARRSTSPCVCLAARWVSVLRAPWTVSVPHRDGDSCSALANPSDRASDCA